MDAAPYPGLDRLKGLALRSAHAAIRRETPDYVRAFLAEWPKTRNTVAVAAGLEPTIGGRFVKWPAALTALLDVEFGLFRVEQSFAMVEAGANDSSPDAAETFVHQSELWIFRADGALDRTEKALKKCVRLMVPGPARAEVQRGLNGKISALKSVVAPFRDKLAHGDAGVDGVTYLWPALLSLDDVSFAIDQISIGFFQTTVRGIGEKRRMSVIGIAKVHSSVVASIVRWCDELCDVVESLDSAR